MTIKMNLQNIKDRVKDDSLDLSLCELVHVPVKEIASIRKVVNLDLSNNLLVSLPKNFTTLTQLVKLDLSKNMLTEIPEGIGELKRLKYLDLYANQISRLPLSMGDLKNLKWLDLKENPLTPAVASVAGPCSDTKECQECARKVVAYLSNVKQEIEQEKLRRLNELAETEKEKEPTSKKEGKKKKKKNIEKENKKNKDTNGCKLEKDLLNKQNTDEMIETIPESFHHGDITDSRAEEVNNQSSGMCWKLLKWSVIWPLVFIILFSILFAVLPIFDKQLSASFIEYVKSRSGVDLRPYQKYSADILHTGVELAFIWSEWVYEMMNGILD